MDDPSSAALRESLDSLIRVQQESVELQRKAVTRLDSIEEKVGCFYIVWLISLGAGVLLFVAKACGMG